MFAGTLEDKNNKEELDKATNDLNKTHESVASVSEKTEKDSNEKTEKSNETASEKIEEEEENPKPIYALASFEWGAYRDAQSKQDKYWYWGSWRKYATYIFSGYKNSLTWDCSADISYLEPCNGCSNCYTPELSNSGTRWWSRFFAKPKPVGKDYSKIINEKCGLQHTKEISTTDFTLLTSNILNSPESKLQLSIGPKSTRYVDFVKEGFKSLKGEERRFEDIIQARQIEIIPKNLNNKEIWFSIDKEEYEAKPIKITILPGVLKVFCKPETCVQ